MNIPVQCTNLLAQEPDKCIDYHLDKPTQKAIQSTPKKTHTESSAEHIPSRMHLLKDRDRLNRNAGHHLSRHTAFTISAMSVLTRQLRVSSKNETTETGSGYARLSRRVPHIPQTRSKHVHNLHTSTKEGFQRKHTIQRHVKSKKPCSNKSGETTMYYAP